jgi:hypothetical protein
MSYPDLVRDAISEEEWRYSAAQVVNRINRGKINATGSVTLTPNATSTVITDARLSIDSFVEFDPMTANAAAEKAAGSLYAATAGRGNGEWTVTHTNNAQTDRTFKYLIIG